MPQRKIINKKINEILSELSLNIEKADFAKKVKLKEDLGLDSLSLISLVMKLNNTFNIEIKSIEIVPVNFMTVGSLEEFIFRKLEHDLTQIKGFTELAE